MMGPAKIVNLLNFDLCNKSFLEKQLCNLDCIRGCAFSEVVRHAPEIHAAFNGKVSSYPAYKNLVAPFAVERHGVGKFFERLQIISVCACLLYALLADCRILCLSFWRYVVLDDYTGTIRVGNSYVLNDSWSVPVDMTLDDIDDVKVFYEIREGDEEVWGPMSTPTMKYNENLEFE